MYSAKRSESLATWTTPQCLFAVEYLPEMLEDIEAVVVAAFHESPQGGIEIGGVLLGSFSSERVTITGVRPLECEHALGPGFRLSAGDHDRLARLIAELHGAGETIVGWFHSHTRTGLHLSEEDLKIHNFYFTDPRQVALVLRPVPPEPTVCGFFFREADGTIHSSGSYREFELGGQPAHYSHDAPEREGNVLTISAPPQSRRRPLAEDPFSQPSPAPAGEYAPLEQDPARAAGVVPLDEDAMRMWERLGQAEQRRKSGAKRYRWVPVLVAATIILALGAAYALRDRLNMQGWFSQPAPVAGQALGLKIQREGVDLILTWDRNAPSMLGATAGLLSIKDGQTQREMGLTAEQLRSASILISPQNDHVEVQLTLLLPDQRTASESGIVILPAQGQSDPVEIKTIVPPKNYTPAEIASQAPRAKAAKPFVPPDRSQSPNAQPMEQPPPLSTADPMQRIRPAGLAASNGDPGHASAPQAVPAPPGGSSLPVHSGGNVQPAEIISRKEPAYPYAARMAGIRGVVVLEGVVGTNGRVKDLKAVSGTAVLRQAAMTAVSQWVYKPALLNGSPIEARVSVEVRFR